MSFENAIERIEKEIEEFDEDSRVLGLYRALEILKEEALPPCPRCKHLVTRRNNSTWCDLFWNVARHDRQFCKYNPDYKNNDLFEPKEKE